MITPTLLGVVMFIKCVSAAILAASTFVSVAHAQGRPPAELPPAGFAGEQYIDSRGCLYIRAGHGGQVNWVSRIDRGRRAICGQTPSLSTMAAARRDLGAPDAAQYVPPPVTYGAPTPLAPVARRAAAPAPVAVQAPAPQPTRQMAQGYDVNGYGGWSGWHRTVDPAYDNNLNQNGVPARGGVETPNTGGHPNLLRRERGCPADAPYGRIYDTADGRNIMLCATQPHTLRNISTGQARQYHDQRVAQGGITGSAPSQVATAEGLLTPPAGYKSAWDDDRLNPKRSWGTPQGQAQMAQVWTNEVPQNLTNPAYTREQPRVTHSSKGTVAPRPVMAGARFVQVGSFGVAENATRAAARLQAMGYPVQVTRSAIRGKPVQIVRAGPFGSEGQAAAALSAARGAGFGDAILRR